MSSVDYTLESLVPTYPPQDDPNIQSIVRSKKEFAELKPEAERVDPIYYNHQVLYQRIHSEYNRIFLIAGAGSGKTGMAICFREWIKTHRPDEYKKYYFITGGTQIEDFKNQLVTKFAKGKYDLNVSSLTQGLSEKAAEKRSARLMKSYIGTAYTLMTYGEFAKYIAKFTNDELKKEFSNVAVFIDEIQMIKIDPQLDLQILKSLQLETNELYDSSDESEIEENDDDDEEIRTKKITRKDLQERERVETYTQIWRVLHVGDNMAVTISTATPTTNHQDETMYEMNLLLGLKKQIWSEISERIARKAEVDVEWYNRNHLRMETISIDVLEELMRGMIMYIREPETGAVAVYPPREKIETLSITPKYVIMSEFQTEAYFRATGGVSLKPVEGKKDLEEIENVVRGNAFLNDSIQCANFVYPSSEKNTTGNFGGVWGRQGLEAVSEQRIVETEKYNVSKQTTKIKRTPIRVPQPWFRNYLRDSKNIRRSSAKMYDIVAGAKDETKGKRYVSTRYYSYSGALILGWCLEAHGFAEYSSEASAFDRRPDGSRRMKLTTTKSPRYAIITSSNKKLHSNIFELFNSPENVRGDYIKVIIVTKVGQVGINLSDIEYVDSLEGDWTPQAKYQSNRRAFRATSHVMSLKWAEEHRGKKQFEVYVNYYIALPDDKFLKSINRSPVEPVDFQLYSLMEAKDRVFSQIFRKMKRIAIDAWINLSRNILPGVYPDGSPECDYDDCEYEPYNNVAMLPDDSTYNAYYADRKIEKTIKLIGEYFTNYSEATHQDLVDAFKPHGHTDRDIILGLERVIHERRSVTKSRIGQEIYLNDDHGRYYVTNSRRLHIDSSCAFYESNIIATENKTLDEITLEYATEAIRLKIGEVYLTGIPRNDYVDFLYRRSIDERSLYFENAVLRLELPETSERHREIAEGIVQTFARISMNLPNQYVNIMKRISEKSQRKKLSDEITEETSSSLGDVWVHYIYGVDLGEAKYDVVRKTLGVKGRLRILSDDVWKDAIGAEKEVYSKILSHRILEKLKPYSVYPIIGIIVTSDTFHLRDNKKDDISKLAGRECKSLSKAEVLNMMYRAGYGGSPMITNYTADERASYLKRTIARLASKADADRIRSEPMTDDMLRFYFIHAEDTPPQLCYNFFKYLQNNNMIFDLLGTQPMIYESMKEATRGKKGKKSTW
ncbi:VV D6-like helicase [uncultured virus]|nr:VV D6-like helicase [uncultured virus]